MEVVTLFTSKTDIPLSLRGRGLFTLHDKERTEDPTRNPISAELISSYIIHVKLKVMLGGFQYLGVSSIHLKQYTSGPKHKQNDSEECKQTSLKPSFE